MSDHSNNRPIAGLGRWRSIIVVDGAMDTGPWTAAIGKFNSTPIFGSPAHWLYCVDVVRAVACGSVTTTMTLGSLSTEADTSEEPSIDFWELPGFSPRGATVTVDIADSLVYQFLHALEYHTDVAVVDLAKAPRGKKHRATIRTDSLPAILDGMNVNMTFTMRKGEQILQIVGT